MSEILDKNKFQRELNDLKVLGLHDHEALVYLALLRLGEVGSSKIIEATDLHGQYVYNALGSLESRGLVQHVIKRGRKKFSAQAPSVLSRLIEHQKQLADTLSEKLQKIAVLPEEQKFEVYRGAESYVIHEFELLKKTEKGTVVCVIGGTGDKFVEIIGSRFPEYENLRKKKEITIRYLGSEEQREELSERDRDLFEFRLLPGLFTGMVNTNIWPFLLGFNIFGEPPTYFAVESSVVAGSYRQFFETLWKIAKK